MKTKILGVIPARYASTRFPGKPIAKIQGREMILWVIEGALQSKSLDDVIVATDDERIQAVVEKAGHRAVMTDSNLPSGTDRIFAASRGLPHQIVVNVQGDEPLIQGPLIDQLVRPLIEDENLEMATLAHEITLEELHSENAVKVVVNNHSEALYFSRWPIPYSRVQPQADQVPQACWKHVGLYAYKVDFLKRFCGAPQSPLEIAESLEQLRALAMGARIKVTLVKERSWGVDTPADLARIEDMLRTRENK